MATTVYLTRHGQTEWNSIGRMMGWTDEDMNETGFAQAERLAARMAKMQLDAIYVSPLKRAITTGTIIGKSHGIAPRPAQGLIEINYGIWEGLARSDVKNKWPELSSSSTTILRNWPSPAVKRSSSWPYALSVPLTRLSRRKKVNMS